MNDDFTLPDVNHADGLPRAPADGDATPIDEVEFITETAEPSPRPPGPGLPESLLWTLGVFIALLGASVVWTLLFVVVLMAQGQRINPVADIDAWMQGMSVNTRIMLLLPANLLAFLLLIPLGLWRLGPYRLRKLNLAPPSLTQLLIVLAAVYPTTIISTPMFALADQAWTAFCDGNEMLEAFNEQSSVMKMMEYLEGGSLVLLLFFLAVVPAVGEEFVFRGLVGRGLTARWGVFRGVLITSILFALLHAYPPHVAAVLPIGVMMHVIYLTTRSFWAPVLFHFINNAMAAIFVSLSVDTEEEMPLWMPAAALAWLVVSIVLLYRYRTRYVNDGGEEISPGYVTVAAPPPDVNARRSAPFGWVAAPVFALVLLGTVYYIVSDVVEALKAAPDAVDGEAALWEAPGSRPRFDVTGLHDRNPLQPPTHGDDARINA